MSGRGSPSGAIWNSACRDTPATPVVAQKSGSLWQLVDSSAIGGIERHIAVLTGALREHGIASKIVLYADHGDNPWLRQLTGAGLPFDVLSGGAGALLRKARAECPALIHTHGYKAGIIGRLVARLAGIAAVSTYHAGERGPWPVCAYQFVDAWTGLLAPRIAVSRQIADALPFAADVVPNFVPMPPESGSPRTGRNVGFVGRLSHEKGPDLFCALANRVGRGFKWHVYGDGPMRQQLEGGAGGVQFHGIAADMEKVWQTLDVLVITSRAEGLPMVALEAMAHGIPVIASKVGALPAVIEQGVSGWLYETGDIDAAARCLDAFVTARAAQGPLLARNCRARIASEFSVERGLARILAIYRRAGFRL